MHSIYYRKTYQYSLQKKKKVNDVNSRGLKRQYENKDKISNQQKLYYEENRDKLLQKPKIRYVI